MIKRDDLILVENAMKKSKDEIGYLLTSISGKRFISSISIEDVLEKAKKEEKYKYLLVFCNNEKSVLNKIKIKEINNKVDKDFVIYIATENEVKEYKI